MNNLQRMAIIPPEIFEKFKQIVLEDNQLTDLDKMMKSILYNKKLNDLNKWHLYRQNLITYSSMKRKNAHRNKFRNPQIKHVEGVASQTRRIYTKEKDTNTEPQVSNKYTQTNFVIPAYKSAGELPTSDVTPAVEDEVFATNGSTTDDDDDDNYIDKSQVRVKRESGGFTTYEMNDGSVATKPKKTILRKPIDGTDQSTLNYPIRKKTAYLVGRTLTRTQSERSKTKWTPIK